MKAREFVRDYVIPAGGVLLKKDGDHHVFRLRSGRNLVVPMGGSQSELAPSVIKRFRTLNAETPRTRVA